MQWLIDIIAERVLKDFQHVIVMWFKPIADIPDGWGLCDGTNGLPDLRNKFIMGCPDGVDPGDVGGTINHMHVFTSDAHDHDMDPNDSIAAGAGFEDYTKGAVVTGTTGGAPHLPPYYKMVYIGKL